MREHDKDKLPGLGAKVVKPATAPKPDKKVKDGVFKDADGRFRTDIAPVGPRKPASPTIWDAFIASQRKAGMP